MKIPVEIIYFLSLVIIVFSLLSILLPSSENNLSTLDPSEMALQISDLPDGFKKISSDPINELQTFQNLSSVKKRYHVMFSKGSTRSDDVMINQYILIIPRNETKNFISIFFSENSNKGIFFHQLSNPNIGGLSIAFRQDDIQNKEIYYILFVKGDVVELISMGGSQTDYEMMKSITKTARKKIK